MKANEDTDHPGFSLTSGCIFTKRKVLVKFLIFKDVYQNLPFGS